ncbi:MAG: hypothetical protein ACX939_07430 [Hyphococcus sp.]
MALQRRHESRAARDMIAAAEDLENRAKQMRAIAADMAQRHDARSGRSLHAVALEAARHALADAPRPVPHQWIENAILAARQATIFAITRETAEIWIRDALAQNTRLRRALRNREIMRRYFSGRTNGEISAEFGLSTSQVARIIAAGKRDAIGAQDPASS